MADPRPRALHIGVDGRELFGRRTGVGRYLAEVLRAWTADPGWPHRLTIVVPAAPGDEIKALAPGATWQVEAAARAGTWWEQTRLRRAVRRARPDVFFAVAYTAPMRLPCPMVVVIHDVSFFAHREWFSRREGARRRWLTRHTAASARDILTVSEFSASEIARHLNSDRRRIHLAPPGTPPYVSGARASAREPIVLYVGSLFDRRHIAELIEGFALVASRVPGARLVLVGDNRTHPRVSPMSHAARLGLGSRVEWREYVSDADLARLYATARVFAFLSDYEGFAMTPFEAMAHGVPPVMLDAPASREVQGSGAVLVPLDPAEIAKAIIRLLTDEDAHAAQVAAGAARLTAFSWTRTAAAVRQALEGAAGRP